MEKEEKEKVIIDYDKYQELLAKANLNEKTIQEIKDAAYKEGLRFGSDEVSKLESRCRDLKTKYFNLTAKIDESYKEGYSSGCYIREDIIYKVCRETKEKLDICFEKNPVSSFLWFWDVYAGEIFRSEIRICVENAFEHLIDLHEDED